MTGQPQPSLAPHIERIGEITRAVHHLCPTHAKPDNKVTLRLSRTERRLFRLFRSEMADRRHDPTQRDAHVAVSLRRRFLDRVQIFAPRAHIRATAEIGRQERLAIDHTVFHAAF